MDADNTKNKRLKEKKNEKRMYIFGIFARVKYLVLCILLLGKLFLFALLNFWESEGSTCIALKKVSTKI